jgi:starvation-inducible outer membrane lipoprotein
MQIKRLSEKSFPHRCSNEARIQKQFKISVVHQWITLSDAFTMTAVRRFSESLVILLWTMATLVSSCSKVPSGILPEKKMKDVMIDVQLAENIINTNYQAYPDSVRKGALFQSVFRKHNITQAIYDSSLVWYGKNLDKLIRVYDLVLNDINGQIRELGDVQANAAPSSANQDSVNIWPRHDYLTLQPEALFNGTIFNIKPEKEYISGSIFVLSMHIWGIRPQMRHTPEVRISAELTDTTLVINQKIINDGHQEIILRTPPTKQTRRVYGYIRMDNTETAYHKIYIDSLRLIKYNYGLTR